MQTRLIMVGLEDSAHPTDLRIHGSIHEFHTRVAFTDFADDIGSDAILGELALDVRDIIGADNHHEADALVEDAIHLGLVDVSQAPEPTEDRKNFPTAAADEHPPSRRQHARNGVNQSSSGYVRP